MYWLKAVEESPRFSKERRRAFADGSRGAQKRRGRIWPDIIAWNNGNRETKLTRPDLAQCGRQTHSHHAACATDRTPERWRSVQRSSLKDPTATVRGIPAPAREGRWRHRGEACSAARRLASRSGSWRGCRYRSIVGVSDGLSGAM